MHIQKQAVSQTENLRRRAEQRVESESATSKQTVISETTNPVLHELRVHQIELEMQNEELRRTQQELETSRARYFDLFDLAPAGYLTLSKQGLILEANLTAATLLGVTRKTLLQQPLSRFILADDQDIYYLLCRRLLETGMDQSRDLRMLGSDRSSFWANLQVSLVQNEEIRIIVSDSSARKGAEEREKNDLNARLNQARKMESVGRLAGGVAHEFNNMLSIILGYATMAMETLEPSSQLHAHMQKIIKAGEHSADIVRQLLTFARKQPVAPQVLDFNSTIANMFRMLKPLIGENIKLFWEPGEQLGTVKMDLTQLDQILVNLVLNARDAMSNNGAITIKTWKVEFDQALCQYRDDLLPGHYLVLEVSDDGCGMDKETLSHIYEPFFTTKPQGAGTGLGLATVYGIVKQNGGLIDVESHPGKGSTFTIYLPRHQPKTGSAATTPKATEIPGGTETVLLAEDHAETMELIKMLLENLGYRVLAATQPKTLLKLAEEYPGVIHLLITDVIMPEMNGRDLHQELSARRPGLKCLFMSGFPHSVIEKYGMLEPNVHLLQKPILRQQLALKLREVLDVPQ